MLVFRWMPSILSQVNCHDAGVPSLEWGKAGRVRAEVPDPVLWGL